MSVGRRSYRAGDSMESALTDINPGDWLRLGGVLDSLTADLPAGARVSGGRARATLRMPDASDGHRRILLASSRDTVLPGIVEYVDFDGNKANQTFPPGDLAHRHNLLYLGGSADRETWCLYKLDFRDSSHMGLYVDDRATVLVNGLSGAGCAGGEVAITGEDVRFIGRNLGTLAEPIFLNHEIESAPAASVCTFRDSFFSFCQTGHANDGDLSTFTDCVVTEQLYVEAASVDAITTFTRVDASAVPLLPRGQRFQIINAGVVSFDACQLATGGALVRFQTAGRTKLGQELHFEGTSIDDTIWVRGIGIVDFVGDFSGPASGDWLYVDATEGALGTAVDVRVNGVNVATLTGVGQSWSPS